MSSSKSGTKGALLLLLTAWIWGVAFVAQSVGMESVEAFTFNGIRMLLGAISLLPIIVWRETRERNHVDAKALALRKAKIRKTLLWGIGLGLVFCVACNVQQFAFYESQPGKIAFITALYIFFVPLLGRIFGKKIPWIVWVSVAIGFVGLFLLCIDPSEGTGVNFGDVLALISSLAFAVHILLVERISDTTDGVWLSCTQFAVAGVISCLCMFLFEHPQWNAIQQASIPILYSGILSCGVAYTFQIIGQKYTEATVASLLLCMESVFAVLASALLLPDTRLSVRETIGCIVMFAAILLSQSFEKIRAWWSRRGA